MADVGSLDEARVEATEVLQDAVQWQLTPIRWTQIESILDALIEAWKSNDGPAFRAATADLELAGPVRIGRLGEKSQVPPTPEIADRLNRLLRSLDGVDPDADTPAYPDDPGDPDGR